MKSTKQKLIDKQEREAFEKAVLLEMVELLVEAKCLFPVHCPDGCSCSTRSKIINFNCKEQIKATVRQQAELTVRERHA